MCMCKNSKGSNRFVEKKIVKKKPPRERENPLMQTSQRKIQEKKCVHSRKKGFTVK